MPPRKICLFAVAMSTVWATSVHAQSCPASPPACDDAVEIPNPVYVLSGDTQVPVLHRVGKKLRAQTDAPITIVYIPNGSCTNLANLYASPPKFTAGTGGGPYYIPADPAFDVTQKTACACTLPGGGITPDLANTIVFPDAASCPSAPAKPAGIIQTLGPVQAMTFVVPFDAATKSGSQQKAITAEEAYLVLGLGAEMAQVPPWSDSSFIYGRPATKGTQISIGANIKVPASKWKLVADAMHQIDQSSALATQIASLATDPNAEKALGILGSEIYDKSTNRAKMHALAFRAFGQKLAYWPDKTATTFDKQNVRDGHYGLWSYVQYLAPDNGMGKAVKAGAQLIMDAFAGKAIQTNPAFEPLDDIIDSGLVPVCAMKVQRSTEGGPLSPYSDPAPCACYFEKRANGSTSCATCDMSTPCSAGICRRGYCEAK